MSDASTRPRPEVKPRVLELPFDGLPRHWMAGEAVPTHISNAVNLLFPLGERFFVRSVKRYFHSLDDPALRAQVKGFFGQEGRHAHEHERLFATLEQQGYHIRGFLRAYERVAFKWLEPRFGPEMALSVTVALEHYTAIMAEGALAHGVLEHADPRVRALLLWHAAEEIEHKAVAFDVLQKVNPSYALRMAGLTIATLGLAGFWVAAAITLLRQEPELRWRDALRQLRRQERDSIARRVFLRGIREYVRRDFHPWQNDNYELARGHLERAEQAA
ncbi:MAG: metal-dependent hydrolase [Myxococcales bacterium]|nr:metal-dependent hydrolase [Myxococcales bacterium]